jgi:HTH-type transcriptional regulator, sugar sensing transcriptional regulator
MSDALRKSLKELGLSETEAAIYLVLLSRGALGASAIASAAKIPRTSVYPALGALAQKGLVDAGAGYASKFSALAPERALPGLIAREKLALREREKISAELVVQLSSFAGAEEGAAETEVMHVLRDPRVVADRFERLLAEAKEQIDCFVKAPMLVPRYDNPLQEQAKRRGVRIRGIYERAVLDQPEIKPYLAKWFEEGEEMRVYEGRLPHKLAIFDQQHILMPLITARGEGRTLSIRHPQLAESLGMLFEFLWESAKPILPQKRARKDARPRFATNGSPKPTQQKTISDSTKR